MPIDDFNIDALREDLRSPYSPRCYSAIRRTMAAIPESVPLLKELYLVAVNTASAPCASAANEAICRHKELAVTFLLQLLDSSNSEDRKNAIRLLLGLGHNRSSWRIHEQVLDDRPNSQPAWGKHRELIIQRLNDSLDDPDSDVITLAATTLDDINETPSSIVDLLIIGLESDDPYIQNISALHLGRLRSLASDALPALNCFVQSQSTSIDETHFAVNAAINAIDRINGT